MPQAHPLFCSFSRRRFRLIAVVARFGLAHPFPSPLLDLAVHLGKRDRGGDTGREGSTPVGIGVRQRSWPQQSQCFNLLEKQLKQSLSCVHVLGPSRWAESLDVFARDAAFDSKIDASWVRRSPTNDNRGRKSEAVPARVSTYRACLPLQRAARSHAPSNLPLHLGGLEKAEGCVRATVPSI